MRQKEDRIVVTFHTTAEAIAMETACKDRGVGGRLIPVPRQISSGCGLAYSAPAAVRESVLGVIRDAGLSYEAEGIYYL